jgi:hypothetical protein
LRKILICHLEYAIIHQVENGHFDIECVAQYAQNTRERLLKYLSCKIKYYENQSKGFLERNQYAFSRSIISISRHY